MNGPAGRARIPALDGLRGLAVAAVLAYHAELPWARGGFLGVSAFFTLSGFLIAGLLLDEHASTGRVALGAFWARRARRLMPAALVTLVAVVAAAPLVATTSQRSSLRGDVLAALLYASNWRFVVDGRDYGGLFAAPSPVQHFWSLAIEEQFYVVFPLVLAVLLRWGRGRRRIVAAVLGAGALASVAAMELVHHGPADVARAYYGTDTRAAELLVGALLAVAVAAWRADPRRFRRRLPDGRARSLVAAAGTVALVFVAVAWTRVDLHDARLFDGGLLVHAGLVAAVIAAAIAGGPAARVLAWRPLRWLGTISYGAYLYHWPVFLWLSPARTGWSVPATTVARLATTLMLAEVSRRVLEEPIRSGRALRPAMARASLALAATAVVVAVVVVTAAPAPAPFTVAAGAGATARSGRSTGPAPSAPPGARPPAPWPAPSATLDLASIELASSATAGPPTPAAPAPAGDAAPPSEPPTTPPPPEPLRVHLAGDSVAFALGGPLTDWGKDNGVAVSYHGWFACAVARGGSYRFAGVPKEMEHRCNDWATVRARDVAELRPHVVVVSYGTFDVLDRQLEPGGAWQHLGQPAYDAYVLDELRELTRVLGSSGARVVWLAPAYVAIGSRDDGWRPPVPFPESDPARIDRYHALVRKVVAETPGASVIDLQQYLRSWPGGELDPRRRPDGVHPTPDAAADIVRWLGPQLEVFRPSR